jgi:serine/threonine protein kinase
MKTSWEGRVLGTWTIHERLGTGGNGIVYRASQGTRQGAIKILKRELWRDKKRVDRFHDEICGMKRCEGLSGVLPLLDCSRAYPCYGVAW